MEKQSTALNIGMAAASNTIPRLRFRLAVNYLTLAVLAATSDFDMWAVSLNARAAKNSIRQPGPGTFGPLFKYLPQPIRDHLQDSYYNALA